MLSLVVRHWFLRVRLPRVVSTLVILVGPQLRGPREWSAPIYFLFDVRSCGQPRLCSMDAAGRWRASWIVGRLNVVQQTVLEFRKRPFSSKRPCAKSTLLGDRQVPGAVDQSGGPADRSADEAGLR